MPAKLHCVVDGQMNITFVKPVRSTPAAVAAFQPSVCQVRQSQPVVTALIRYHPKTEPVTVIRPLDSSSKKALRLVELPVSAFWTAALVNGWVARSLNLIRITAMRLATGVATVAEARVVVDTVAV